MRKETNSVFLSFLFVIYFKHPFVELSNKKTEHRKRCPIFEKSPNIFRNINFTIFFTLPSTMFCARDTEA